MSTGILNGGNGYEAWQSDLCFMFFVSYFWGLTLLKT